LADSRFFRAFSAGLFLAVYLGLTAQAKIFQRFAPSGPLTSQLSRLRRLALQNISNLAKEFLFSGRFGRLRRFGRFFEPVDLLHHEEQHERDDQELDNRVKKRSIR